MNFWILVFGKACPDTGCFEWEIHQKVSAGEFFAAKVLATIRRRRKLLFKEREVRVEIRLEKHRFDFSSYAFYNRFDKEWHRGILNV